jgi:NAD(P)-dependent dehydrogenase (short-subunit alcohol dehydrogenase family)
MSMLQQKVAIVTGAADPAGIGFAIARTFAQHGARVAILDLSTDACVAAAHSISQSLDGHSPKSHPPVLGFGCDIRDVAACRETVARIRSSFGDIDILVNNAGITQPRKLTEITVADYEKVVGTNLFGTLNVSQCVVPHMNDGGSVICVASIAAQRGGGFLGGPHYAASKGGMVSLAKSMARELGPRSIRVNSIAPGIILTNMNATAYDEDSKKEILRTIPLARFGRPDDVAGACLFLASDFSAYMTGATLDINGGNHIH